MDSLFLRYIISTSAKLVPEQTDELLVRESNVELKVNVEQVTAQFLDAL